MEKSEIAHSEQFHLFPQFFPKTFFFNVLKWVYMEVRVSPSFHKYIKDENGKKSFKQVANTVGKGEIARYEQFLLFPQCFQKACFPGTSKGVIVWEWVKPFPNDKF